MVQTLNLAKALSESREAIKAAAGWIIGLHHKARYGIHVLEQALPSTPTLAIKPPPPPPSHCCSWYYRSQMLHNCHLDPYP